MIPGKAFLGISAILPNVTPEQLIIKSPGTTLNISISLYFFSSIKYLDIEKSSLIA